MNNKKFIVRQGDIKLERIESIPKGAKILKDKILAYGEITGHTHRFKEPKNIERYEFGENTYLRVYADTPLIHEEHNTLIIPVGDYKQEQEREYSYEDADARIVID